MSDRAGLTQANRPPRNPGPFKLVVVPGFDEKRRTSFDEAEHEFVKGLRNAIFHIELPTIGWQISYGKTKTTDFVLPVDGLRHHADLSSKAQAFLDRSGKSVSVREVVVAYAARVRAFYAWFKQAVESHPAADLSDFRRIKRLCLATASRKSYRLLVGLALERKIDPYPRLSQHLLPDELAGALAMPMRSREQVDFIISIVDEHGGCDEALRQQVYTLFGAM